VRKFVEATRTFGRELWRVQLNLTDKIGPAVVGEGFDCGMDKTDGPHCEFGGGHRTHLVDPSAHRAEFLRLDLIENADFAGLAKWIDRIA